MCFLHQDIPIKAKNNSNDNSFWFSIVFQILKTPIFTKIPPYFRQVCVDFCPYPIYLKSTLSKTHSKSIKTLSRLLIRCHVKIIEFQIYPTIPKDSDRRFEKWKILQMEKFFVSLDFCRSKREKMTWLNESPSEVWKWRMKIRKFSLR